MDLLIVLGIVIFGHALCKRGQHFGGFACYLLAFYVALPQTAEQAAAKWYRFSATETGTKFMTILILAAVAALVLGPRMPRLPRASEPQAANESVREQSEA